MYRTCLFCNESLGANHAIEHLPTGRRLAFDAARGRLWVVCVHCRRWNLTLPDERWEALEECERAFRGTLFRTSTDNIGLTRLADGTELVRIGEALRPEIAAWRYGHEMARRRLSLPRRIGFGVGGAASRVARLAAAVRYADAPNRLAHEPLTRINIFRRRHRVLDVTTDERGQRVVIRYGHLDDARLIRPEANEHWRVAIRLDGGTATISGDSGLHTAAKMLAALNALGGTADDVRDATRRVEDAYAAESYFARIAALALRTSWGRFPDALPMVAPALATSASERLALHITNRSFWGRGGLGSEPASLLLHLPVIDRLALEMAANEDIERRAMAGELAELEAAWREAEEIASIADGLFEVAGEMELRRKLR